MREVAGRRRSAPARAGAWMLTLAVAWVATASCVGSDGADARSQPGTARPGAASAKSEDVAGADAQRGAVIGAEYSEDVEPLEYQIFEQVVSSSSPRKTLHRLLVLFPDTRARLVKTARVALDSIAAADTAAVAARAILYAFRQTGPREGDVIPIVWAEWVPPEGWAEADSGSRGRLHRTYVYFGVPAWSEDDADTIPAPSRR